MGPCSVLLHRGATTLRLSDPLNSSIEALRHFQAIPGIGTGGTTREEENGRRDCQGVLQGYLH